MNRRPLSTRERLRLYDLHGGLCHICNCVIDRVRDRWDVEHVLALALGGADDDDNRQPAHTRCHKVKTADDLGHIAKAKRREAKHLGAKPPSSRPMPGNRNSKWKKTVSHGWVLR